MNEVNPSYSLEERARIAKTARRSALGEASAIWSVGGALITLLSMFGLQTLVLVISDHMGVQALAIFVVFGIVGGGILALIHMRRLSPKIIEAQRLDAEIKYAHQDELRAEKEAKMANLIIKK